MHVVFTCVLTLRQPFPLGVLVALLHLFLHEELHLFLDLVVTNRSLLHNWSLSTRKLLKTVNFLPKRGLIKQGRNSLGQTWHQQTPKRTKKGVVDKWVTIFQYSSKESMLTLTSIFKGHLERVNASYRIKYLAVLTFNLLNLYAPLFATSVVSNCDLRKLAVVPGSVDVAFHPPNLYDYGGGHESWVRAEKLELGLCGKSRPVFYRGVATLVTKLFNIVEPDVALFGKKDYQQWRIIQRIVRDLDFSIKVIGAEIIRDNDGLATSSRNVHLSPEEREKALSINKSLLKAKSAAKEGQVHCEKLQNLAIKCITDAGGRIDYAEIVAQNNLEKVEQIKGPVVFCVAAWFGKVRLVDNMEINL
ncbi:hypothetical protein Fmac_005936 [Flemingia macrophylla]|uniref:Pantoate--beta-alanine ligase n=1 Tax=Flemingia macrophylla TaxID=520843 RepID=A0ABD1N974_9FABA